MSTGGIVLSKLLLEQDLEQWSRLKNEYFSAELRPAYRAIFKFYNNYERLPTLEELQVTARNSTLKDILVILEQQELPEVDLSLAVDALIDEFVQGKTLNELDEFLDDITVQNSSEIIGSLQNIVLDLEELVHTNSEIHDITDIDIFQEPEDITFIPLGLNNTLDQTVLGAGLTELWIFGGFRGGGKSIVCSNIQVNEYLAGYVAPYFSIEMTASEVMKRNIAIQSETSALNIRNNSSTPDERIKIMKAIASRYKNGEQFFEDFWKNKSNTQENCLEFQRKIRSLELNEVQMPIVHCPELTLTDLDLYLQKFKTRYGDKMRVAILDYVNQVEIPGSEEFDWQTQIKITKQIKKLAAKYDVCIVSPYQVNEKGVARFSKGLLISVDVALLLNTEKPEQGHLGTIEFNTDKVRSLPNISCRSGINWNTLKIDPQDCLSLEETGLEENEEDPKESIQDPW